jgi:Holliday junction resolvase RusA-like endonuclease
MAQLAMGGLTPFTGPVSLTALVEMPIPASWSKRRAAAAVVGIIRPTSRPDVDNFLKSAMDAINGIVVTDDSLIVSVKAEKKFGLDPKLVLLIESIAASPSNREVR